MAALHLHRTCIAAASRPAFGKTLPCRPRRADIRAQVGRSSRRSPAAAAAQTTSYMNERWLVSPQAYLDPSALYAVTQQTIAFAIVSGADVYLERNSGVAPDVKVVGAGALACLAALAALNSGSDLLLTPGLVLGTLAAAALMVYHAKRIVDASESAVCARMMAQWTGLGPVPPPPSSHSSPSSNSTSSFRDSGQSYEFVAGCAAGRAWGAAVQEGYLRGHGTHIVDERLIATLCGVVERVDRLVFVRPLKTRYDAAQGDVVVGRVTEVAGKRWKVDLAARQEASLLLSAVHLPGGAQRRRNAEDELAMRDVLREGDLLSAEVQAVQSDGGVALHTRSNKYGKLAGGQLVAVPPALVKRQKQHFHNIEVIGVSVILGCNGLLWVSPTPPPPPAALTPGLLTGGQGGEAVAVPPPDWQPSRQQLEAVVRVGNAIRALARCYLPIYATTIMDAYEVRQCDWDWLWNAAVVLRIWASPTSSRRWCAAKPCGAGPPRRDEMSLDVLCSTDTIASLTGAGFTEEQANALCSTLLGQVSSSFATNEGITDFKYGVNTAWLVICSAMVFIMHGGFAMLCAGAIRSKNTLNILLQTIMDACVSAIAFYIVGFAFAYGEGDKPNRFIGDAIFVMNNWQNKFTGVGNGRWTDWLYQWAFAATAVTIPAGAVAERFNFNAYLAYTVLLAAFVYPVVVHWVWSREGWLTHFSVSGNPAPAKQEDEMLFRAGMIDFAGSGVVHMVGGMCGLMGAWLVGPRLGRFDSNGKPVDMPGHSATLVVLGTVLLWFGWYGFNPGSSLTIDNSISAQVAGRAAVTTTLSGAAAGLTCLMNGFRRNKAWDLISMCNGVLVGFVVITACAHVVEPWAAIVNGVCGALPELTYLTPSLAPPWMQIFDLVSWLFLKLRIDDPLCAAPMHGFGGMWGVFFTGLLAKQEYIQQAYGTGMSAPYTRGDFYGLFYGGGGRLLASQVIGILAIAGWVCGTTGILFFALKMLNLLRISEEEEHRGLDASKHGGSAYNTDVYGRTAQDHTP
ncbi:hypothetical protein QJQ45_025976, partial [Haematococcus lacustris]